MLNQGVVLLKFNVNERLVGLWDSCDFIRSIIINTAKY